MGSKGRILLVEDEKPIADVVADYLKREGFQTHHLSSGAQVIPWLEAYSADLVLLDIMLPEIDGLEICKALRRTTDIPIIMLTARVEEIDKLIGLEIGADDYICKPFSPREVVARVKTVLRRAQATPRSSDTADDVVIDPQSFMAHILGQRLDLTPTEFKLLAALGRRRGQVLSRAQLLDAIDGNQDVFDRAIDSHIKNLRRKIADVVCDQDVIQSVYGVGYRLENQPLIKRS